MLQILNNAFGGNRLVWVLLIILALVIFGVLFALLRRTLTEEAAWWGVVFFLVRAVAAIIRDFAVPRSQRRRPVARKIASANCLAGPDYGVPTTPTSPERSQRRQDRFGYGRPSVGLTPLTSRSDGNLAALGDFCRMLGRETHQGEVGLGVGDEYFAIRDFGEGATR